MRRGDDFGIGEWAFVQGLELALETFGGEGGCHDEFIEMMMITDDGQAELLALAIVYGLIAAEIGDIWKYERKVGVGEQRLLLLFPGSGMAEMRHAV